MYKRRFDGRKSVAAFRQETGVFCRADHKHFVASERPADECVVGAWTDTDCNVKALPNEIDKTVLGADLNGYGGLSSGEGSRHGRQKRVRDEYGCCHPQLPYMGWTGGKARNLSLILLANDSRKTSETVSTKKASKPFSHEPPAIKAINPTFLSQ